MDYEQNAEAGEEVQQGVVVVVHRAGRFLMIRRTANVLAGGAWCFVGGAIEPGETQRRAVVREFAEELGGRVTPLRKIWEYTRRIASFCCTGGWRRWRTGAWSRTGPKWPRFAGAVPKRWSRCRRSWRATFISCEMLAGGWSRATGGSSPSHKLETP